jgi:hypothetical protein
MFSAFQSNAFQDNAFQIAKVIPFPTPKEEGGGKGSGKRRKKPKRVYVERDGKIYVFADEGQAQAWVQAVEQQQVEPKKAKARKEAKELISPPIDKIEIGSAKELAEKYGKQPLITELIRSKEYDELVYQYKMLFALETAARFAELQEEEEITILLMAA